MTATRFLRFYGQTDEGVAACVAELKAANPKIMGFARSGAWHSMNLQKPSHEINLLFKDEAEAMSMDNNEALMAIYKKHAAPGQKVSGVHQKKPGEAVFKF